MKGNCLEETVVYQAKIVNGDTTKVYTGSTEGQFKTRYNNHTHSFRDDKKRNSTALSLFVWNNDLSPTPTIEWSIRAKSKPYKPGNKNCQLCLEEKLCIIQNIGKNDHLNRHNEIARKCMHKRAFTLGRFNEKETQTRKKKGQR